MGPTGTPAAPNGTAPAAPVTPFDPRSTEVVALGPASAPALFDPRLGQALAPVTAV